MKKFMLEYITDDGIMTKFFKERSFFGAFVKASDYAEGALLPGMFVLLVWNDGKWINAEPLLKKENVMIYGREYI